MNTIADIFPTCVVSAGFFSCLKAKDQRYSIFNAVLYVSFTGSGDGDGIDPGRNMYLAVSRSGAESRPECKLRISSLADGFNVSGVLAHFALKLSLLLSL